MSQIAEKNVIGCLLMDSSSIEISYDILSVDMFTSNILGRIYLEYQRGYDNGYNVTLPFIQQKLSDDFDNDYILEVLAECGTSVYSSTEIRTNAKVILNDYKAKLLRNIVKDVNISPNDIDTEIGVLQSRLEQLQNNEKSCSRTLSDIVKDNKGKYFCETEERKIYTGFDNLDDLLGGLEGGDMIVIGARPGVGKSAFVTQMTSNFAKQGIRVGFYNLEMQEKQLYERFVVSESGIGLTRLRRAKNFLGDEKEKFDMANDILEKRNNIVITTGSKTVGKIRQESKHMNYDVIVIDYLQLLQADKTYRGNRYAEVGNISKSIKAMAMEFNIPVIALSQLNRVSEQKETKEPTMSELREAGDIEQDASVILLMWNLTNDRIKKGLKLEKQRQGMTGTEVLQFNGDLMKFEETSETVKEATQWTKKEEDTCPFQ